MFKGCIRLLYEFVGVYGTVVYTVSVLSTPQRRYKTVFDYIKAVVRLYLTVILVCGAVLDSYQAVIGFVISPNKAVNTVRGIFVWVRVYLGCLWAFYGFVGLFRMDKITLKGCFGYSLIQIGGSITAYRTVGAIISIWVFMAVHSII